MADQEENEALDRCRSAGAESFNHGKPCVPGLDPLWHREARLYGPFEDPIGAWAEDTAKVWREGWKNQAALVERVAS